LLSFVKLRGYAAFSDRIPEDDAHISTTETKHGASRRVADVGELTFHSSTKGGAFKGPQRVPIEQQFGQYNASEVDNPSVTSHDMTPDGRLKMGAFGQTKKRNRDEIEQEGDGTYWVESQAKRHKTRHHEEAETVKLTYLPFFIT
jgi:hypothetical protein